MPIENNGSKLTVAELISRCRGEMIPVTNKFSYFAASPLVEDEVRQYLEEPIAALPPGIVAKLPHVGLILVPYLERREQTEGPRSGHVHPTAEGQADFVVFERPADPRQFFVARQVSDEEAMLIFATKEEDVADYHYSFYNAVAGLVANAWRPDGRDPYYRLLREELKLEVHGEVDERSWHLKQGLSRRQSNIRKETKTFRDYARQSLEDTLTLYLHGICCDIDVETGPRQLPSRQLRKRLEMLNSLYPPPQGYTIFPEQVRNR